MNLALSHQVVDGIATVSPTIFPIPEFSCWLIKVGSNDGICYSICRQTAKQQNYFHMFSELDPENLTTAAGPSS